MLSLAFMKIYILDEMCDLSFLTLVLSFALGNALCHPENKPLIFHPLEALKSL